MSLDLDPIYQTETMVKILRDQGSTLRAMELCEKILEKNPGHEKVRSILEDLKAEARASFDRFRGATNPNPPSKLPEQNLATGRLQKLEILLLRVQEYRRVHG